MSYASKQHQTHVNFDELLTLAKSDPVTFESKREEYIESFLTSVSTEKQTRLRGLQWRIDQTRNLARTPMAACIAISSMMWDSLHKLGDRQRELVKLTNGQSNQFMNLAPTPAKAPIIPFPAR
jgi:Protein of unknown function (DUF3135)